MIHAKFIIPFYRENFFRVNFYELPFSNIRCATMKRFKKTRRIKRMENGINIQLRMNAKAHRIFSFPARDIYRELMEYFTSEKLISVINMQPVLLSDNHDRFSFSVRTIISVLPASTFRSFPLSF